MHAARSPNPAARAGAAFTRFDGACRRPKHGWTDARIVVAANPPVGRLEEFYCEQRAIADRSVGDRIGRSEERLNVRSLFGESGHGKVARWTQLDISNPEHPRSTCSADDLADRVV